MYYAANNNTVDFAVSRQISTKKHRVLRKSAISKKIAN